MRKFAIREARATIVLATQAYTSIHSPEAGEFVFRGSQGMDRDLVLIFAVFCPKISTLTVSPL
jgi:hypothetical protein